MDFEFRLMIGASLRRWEGAVSELRFQRNDLILATTFITAEFDL